MGSPFEEKSEEASGKTIREITSTRVPRLDRGAEISSAENAET
jgi:hypothetical protein